jgi:hypothetical protein
MVFKNRLLSSSALAVVLSCAVLGQSVGTSFFATIALPPACVGGAADMSPMMPQCDLGDEGAVFIIPSSGVLAVSGTVTYGGSGSDMYISGPVANATLDGIEYPTRPVLSPRPDRIQSARDRARWLRFGA